MNLEWSVRLRLTADNKEIKDFPKIALWATSFIRKTLADIASNSRILVVTPLSVVGYYEAPRALVRTGQGNGAQNFAVLRHIALNLLRREDTANCSIRAKRLKAGGDHDYLLSPICLNAIALWIAAKGLAKWSEGW